MQRSINRMSMHLRDKLGALRSDQSAVSVVEFALSLPMVVALGMFGIEVANMASTHMQVSQIALSVADNASRLGQTDNAAVAPMVNEADIDAVMFGAMQQGAAIDLEANGRVILSSLERDPDTGRQYIHWQRCAGEMERDSAYGNDGDENGLTGDPIPGLGQPGRVVAANAGQAVMFAEVYYTYQPIFAGMLLDEMTFRQEAALLVRDDRDLDEDGDGLIGTPASTCAAAAT